MLTGNSAAAGQWTGAAEFMQQPQWQAELQLYTSLQLCCYSSVLNSCPAAVAVKDSLPPTQLEASERCQAQPSATKGVVKGP